MLTKCPKKKLDNYTRMLHAALNRTWIQHPTKQMLYGHPPPILQTIKVRQTRHARHCCWSKDKLKSDVLLWTSTHEHANVVQQALCRHWMQSRGPSRSDEQERKRESQVNLCCLHNLMMTVLFVRFLFHFHPESLSASCLFWWQDFCGK